ncbi:uncharacterized protein LOC124553300 [Schistocerca americana]|uniref:uncharacterized protein LOC124553300 n=1 Tax=Schistocerca americana TaxID=7009 RepID=UPI001F504138|nr:uncharacterized protein LOC124553300 [Schistocerca americana]
MNFDKFSFERGPFCRKGDSEAGRGGFCFVAARTAESCSSAEYACALAAVGGSCCSPSHGWEFPVRLQPASLSVQPWRRASGVGVRVVSRSESSSGVPWRQRRGRLARPAAAVPSPAWQPCPVTSSLAGGSRPPRLSVRPSCGGAAERTVACDSVQPLGENTRERPTSRHTDEACHHHHCHHRRPRHRHLFQRTSPDTCCCTARDSST